MKKNLIPTIVFCWFLALPEITSAENSTEIEALLRSGSDDKILLSDRHGSTVRSFNRSYLAMIMSIWTNIQRTSEHRAILKISEGKQPNAYATKSDGKEVVVVNLAMIDLIGDDRNAWAALLGHEIAHLKLDHRKEALKRKIPLKIIDWLVERSDPSKAVGIASGLLTSGIDMKYSRKHERESDYRGTIWAFEAGYDPMGAVFLHEALSERDRIETVPFLRSHPTSEERIRRLSELAKDLEAR